MLALIVEDDKETLEDISLAFKICLPDCEIISTNSKEECLGIVKSKLPSIIILDRDLQNCDIYGVLQQVHSCSRAPIIFLSSTEGDSETIQALELGADELITKPIRQLLFIARVRALLRKTTTENNMSNPSIKKPGQWLFKDVGD